MMLDRYARSWIDLQQTRKALAQRGIDERFVESFEKNERALSAHLSKLLRSHDLWPWLSQFPGLGGAHTALIVGRIGDPRRFPGQRCSLGHYLPDIYEIGAPCPVAADLVIADEEEGGREDPLADERKSEIESLIVCEGVMLAPRPTTGVRSLWHYSGVHVVEGRLAKRKKGVKSTWDPRIRTSILQPGGLAEHIVRGGIRVIDRDTPTERREALHVYAERYLEKKALLQLRALDFGSVGDPAAEGTDIPDPDCEIEQAGGDANGAGELRLLRPFEIEKTARLVAVKEFLADMLVEWKRVTS